MADKKKRAISERFTSPLVEFAHCYIYEPDSKDAEGASEFADDKYKVSCFISKERIDELKPMKQICLQTAKKEFGNDIKWKELETPFHDGDEALAEKIEKVKKSDLKDEEKKTKIERLTQLYAGKVYFTPKSKKEPGVVDREAKPLEEENAVQSTDTGRVRISAMAYERPVTEIVNGKKTKTELKGVSLLLSGVQKDKEGPRPFAGPDGSKEFEALPTESAGDDDVTDDEDFEDSTPKKEESKPAKSSKKKEPEPKESEDDDEDDDEII